MNRPPPRSTRTETLFPFPTLCRSAIKDRPVGFSLIDPAEGRSATADHNQGGTRSAVAEGLAAVHSGSLHISENAVVAPHHGTTHGHVVVSHAGLDPRPVTMVDDHSFKACGAGHAVTTAMHSAGKRSEEHTSELQSLM